jgi:two-component system sensor histidine kinase DegS
VRRLLGYREADRRELAERLHDEAAQTLANVALRLQICERAIAVDPERGRAELVDARGVLSEAIARLRQQIFALRPVTLEESGLGATLRRLAGAMPARDGQTVQVEDELGGERLDPDIELGLYRVGQAALERAIAHANRVTLRLGRAGGGTTVLSVTSDGTGPMDEDDPRLHTIRDWGDALGAQIEIESGLVRATLRA